MLRELATSKNCMKQFVDNRRSEWEFAIEDHVCLKLKRGHLKTLLQGLVSKLSPKFYGPYPITTRIGNVAYQLQLPEDSKIHLMFHVSLRKKSVGSSPVSSSLPSLPASSNVPMESTAIIDKQVIYKQGAPITQVLVKWAHLHSDNTT